MQIHELNSFVGTPSATDYLAIDDGTETNKVPATALGVSTQMTQAEAEAGTVTDPRVVSPSVFKASVESLAEPVAETVAETVSETVAERVVETAVSSGSNSNGKWVRFIDGTQICTKSMAFNVSFTRAFGSWYETQSFVSFGDWSVPFINDDIVITVGVINRACVVESIQLPSATSAGQSYLMRPDNTANQDIKIHLIAIGRWK